MERYEQEEINAMQDQLKRHLPPLSALNMYGQLVPLTRLLVVDGSSAVYSRKSAVNCLVSHDSRLCMAAAPSGESLFMLIPHDAK